jgi:hypothetical protein
MSVRNAKNNLSLFIGKNIARTASVQITDPDVTATYIADGEIVIAEPDGTIMTNASTITTSPKFQVIQRSGNRLLYSPIISGANVIAYNGIDGSAGSEQISYIGYNGSTGSIDVSGTADYTLNLTFTFNEQNWSTQLNNFPFIVDAESGAVTQDEVAESLARQINYQLSGAGQLAVAGEGPLVRATILCDEAGSAITGTGTITARKDSKTITAGTDIDALMVVGDYIRIASTATTGAVYKIVSMNTTANTAELSMPFQGTTVVASAEGNHEYITAAAMAAAECGVVLTGQALKWQLDFFKYMQVTFKVGLKEFGTTTFSTTAAVRPVNNGYQIAEIESFTEGLRGKLNRTVVPLPTAKADADTSAVYDSISIAFYDDSDLTPIDGTKPARQEVMIAIVDGASQIATGANSVELTLDAYMATTPRAFAGVTL